jgi:hypothetical protein
MSGPDKEKRDALVRLVNALVDDILAASDEEILAELAETQDNPAKAIEATRALFERGVANAKKARLRAAQAGLAASRSRAPSRRPDMLTDARNRLRLALAACPPDIRVTIAARNESELSDNDVLGMLQDLEELGIVASDDESDIQS